MKASIVSHVLVTATPAMFVKDARPGYSSPLTLLFEPLVYTVRSLCRYATRAVSALRERELPYVLRVNLRNTW